MNLIWVFGDINYGSPRRLEFHSLLKLEQKVVCAQSPLQDVPPQGILGGLHNLPSALNGNRNELTGGAGLKWEAVLGMEDITVFDGSIILF